MNPALPTRSTLERGAALSRGSDQPAARPGAAPRGREMQLQRLKESGVVRSFLESFRQAMGLPLQLRGPGEMGSRGSCETSAATIPVRLGSDVIADLQLGPGKLAPLPSAPGADRKPAGEEADDAERFQAALALVGFFADQVSRLAEDLHFADTGREPAGITKATRRLFHV